MHKMSAEAPLQKSLQAPRALGHHLILDLWDCDPSALISTQIIQTALTEAVKACEATLIEMRLHTFPTGGITGMAIVKESHISIHTWPELRYAAVDIFTCGATQAEAAAPVFRRHLMPGRTDMLEIRRGMLS